MDERHRREEIRREEIRVPGMPPPVSHYVDVVRAGPFLFVSGCVAVDEDGRTVGGSDVVAQARRVHENLKTCLAAGGATFADVCKVTVFLRNIADRGRRARSWRSRVWSGRICCSRSTRSLSCARKFADRARRSGAA